MRIVDFYNIVREAWADFDPERKMTSIVDISVMVSTNHVYKITLADDSIIYAKLSYFGKFEHFVEDHTIINVMASLLSPPYDHFLSNSMMKDGKVYTFRHTDNIIDAWVVFYQPIEILHRLPRIQEEKQITKLGQELAKFHMVCHNIKPKIPASSKTLFTDIDHLLDILSSEQGSFEHRGREAFIREQCKLFKENSTDLGFYQFERIPVFVDWNIGNFSVTDEGAFYSRWDYDWFRVSSRVMDFYFFSRVVSSIGDKTVFKYVLDPMMEDRFLLFLKAYHDIYPLKKEEILFMKEAYRFFILNYVIKDGRYFFHEIYATRLQKEAYEEYFPDLDQKFNPDKILKTLGL